MVYFWFDSNNMGNLFGIPLFHFILEILLLVLLIIIWKRKKTGPKQNYLYLTPQEEETIINEWLPEPLVSACDDMYLRRNYNFTSKLGKYVEVDGDNRILNFSTTNFLNFIGNEKIESSAIECIKKYSVGTCGPRGFYGTTDIHLKLEKKLAEFWNTDEAIIYSYGYSTFSSAICSFCKKQDYVFVDDGICFTIQTGIVASRSKVIWFKHNDYKDLEEKLKSIQLLELENPRKFRNIRKFIIIEGIYLNYGDIANLPLIMNLKNKYQTRLFIDESLSIGVIGKTGRGLTEYYNIPISDIDLISFSFENSFSSNGGACIGSTEVIDHQRLSAVGYSFSASSPTFLCQVILDEISMMESDDKMMSDLYKKSSKIYELLSKRLNKKLHIDGCPESPLLHIRYNQKPTIELEWIEQINNFDKVIDMCFKRDLLILQPDYIREREHLCPYPSIRITIGLMHDITDLIFASEIIITSIDDVLKSSV